MQTAIIVGYESPNTQWVRVDMDETLMAASDDTVVDDKTEISIDRQEGAQASKLDDNGNVVADGGYTVGWQ